MTHKLSNVVTPVELTTVVVSCFPFLTSLMTSSDTRLLFMASMPLPPPPRLAPLHDVPFAPSFRLSTLTLVIKSVIPRSIMSCSFLQRPITTSKPISTTLVSSLQYKQTFIHNVTHITCSWSEHTDKNRKQKKEKKNLRRSTQCEYTRSTVVVIENSHSALSNICYIDSFIVTVRFNKQTKMDYSVCSAGGCRR